MGELDVGGILGGLGGALTWGDLGGILGDLGGILGYRGGILGDLK